VSLERAIDALERALPGAVERDAKVSELTTYRLGGPVAALVRAADDAALDAVGAVVASEPDLRTLVIGRGSNLLVADSGFAGVALLLTGTFEELEVEPGGLVRAGGAVPLPVVARRAAAAGLAGLEFLVGIPGSVGGAVRMNAGGHGRETSEVLSRARVLTLGQGAGTSAEWRDGAGLELRYRHSNVGASDVVTQAELVASPDDASACEARVSEIVRWRREHQPGGANGGSVFRNPPGDSAGRIIDAVGLKGLRVGAAFVSPKHANFFQADVGATADDVRRLVDEVRTRVATETGVILEPELRMIGFADRGCEPREAS